MLGDIEGADLVLAPSSAARQPVGGVAKRSFDIVASLCAIIMFLPLIAAIVLLLKWKNDGSVLFKQTRIGFAGRQFACYKFRSMVADADRVLKEHLASNVAARHEWENTQKLKDDPRITPVGRFLRTTSLDELPQLFNILVGDMSVVGPRPIVQSEVSRYGSDFAAYAAGRPGLTGLWQVSGRSDCSYPERVALDTRYVQQWNFGLDLKIVMRTFHTVLARRGSY
jgi:lipopolysaccharide/colanic/teichoic acid biosynthesis glycosyltransferase